MQKISSIHHSQMKIDTKENAHLIQQNESESIVLVDKKALFTFLLDLRNRFNSLYEHMMYVRGEEGKRDLEQSFDGTTKSVEKLIERVAPETKGSEFNLEGVDVEKMLRLGHELNSAVNEALAMIRNITLDQKQGFDFLIESFRSNHASVEVVTSEKTPATKKKKAPKKKKQDT